MDMQLQEFLKSAAAVKPSARQMSWFDTEFYAFVHFTVNTYTDKEWGDGTEDPAIFNPVELDCDKWVEAVKSAGLKGIVLTAKHHDGFCLWPSAYTEHSVKNSPWKNGQGDVVRECAEACRRGGIKFGVYLSPWDRNCSVYGSEAYNDFYVGQLTELLTGYGELFMVWFDGACGEGPNGRKQVYDFDRYISLIRKYQPNACIFNDAGPDVRWCGNEAGMARAAEWAVVPSELCFRAEVQTGAAPLAGDLSYLYNDDPYIGEMHSIMHSKGLVFCASEVDMSIRPGWFWHANEEPHSLERLMRTYVNSCGGNTSVHLNIPPMPSGQFDPRDVARLRELGEALRDAFGEDKKVDATITAVPQEGGVQVKYEIDLSEETEIRYLELREDIANAGQRIENFRILTDGDCAFRGRTVGHRKICTINRKAKHLTVHITAARDEIAMRDITLYRA